jgi:putative hydrolase of the HAD superfamily
MLIDLDGTIIDSTLSAEEAWKGVCCEFAPELGVASEALYAAITESAGRFWADAQRAHEGRADLRLSTRRIVEQAINALGAERKDLAAVVGDCYRDRRDEFYLVSGAVPSLEALRSHGVALALITNGAGPVQRAKIERFDLARHFDCVLIEGELGFGKPDERVYRNAMAALSSSPSDTWVVGDDLDWEVAAPQRLGLYTVWVDSRGLGLPSDATARPDRVIQSLAELMRAVNQWTLAASER